jgi:hypothetical protein
MTGDCRHCKDFRECLGDIEWFHYGQIRFCPHQILWILRHSETLRDGDWPQDPINPGDDNPNSKIIKTEASFVKPILILAEVESRLKRTGIHGKLLVAQIEAGRELNTLDREAMDALFYVQGWQQKRDSFTNWKRIRRWRKETLGVSKDKKEEKNALSVC